MICIMVKQNIYHLSKCSTQDLGLAFVLLCGETGLSWVLNMVLIINAQELVSVPEMPLDVF